MGPRVENKYSVGQNAGYKLNADGGIEILIAANEPPGVPPENWLPINREDQGISPMLRLYAPDLSKAKTWKPPKAQLARPRHSGSTAISASIRRRATASGARPSRAQPRSKSRPMTALAPGQLPQQPASSSFLSSQADFLDSQSGLFRWFPTHSRHWRSMGRRVRRQRCRPGILARR